MILLHFANRVAPKCNNIIRKPVFQEVRDNQQSFNSMSSSRSSRSGRGGKGKGSDLRSSAMSYQPGLIPKKRGQFEPEETVSEKALEQKARGRYMKDRGPELEEFQLGHIKSPFLILANGFPSDDDKATTSSYIVLFDEESIAAVSKAEASVDMVWGSTRTTLNSCFKKEIIDKDGAVRPVIRAKITKKEEGVFFDKDATITATNGDVYESQDPPSLADLVPGRTAVGQTRGVAWRRGAEYGVTFYINKILVGPMDEQIVDRKQPGGGSDAGGEPKWQ